MGSWGNPEDGLDFRSPSDIQGNADRLFHNKGDGTFEDITDSAFGDAVNVRSAASAACADVDGDGWLDIYVGNLGAEDFRVFTTRTTPATTMCSTGTTETSHSRMFPNARAYAAPRY